MLSLNSKVQAVVKLPTNLNTGIDPGYLFMSYSNTVD